MKIALVTGANRSIGLETVKQLSRRNHFVYLGSRTLAKGQAVVKTLAEQGFGNISAIEIDVTEPGTIAAAVATVEREHSKLDVLINNAGILGDLPQHATTVDVETFRQVFDTNLYGAIRVTQGFIPLLKQSTAPRIVNVSSNVGSLTLQSDPEWPYYEHVKWSVYSASKAALNMYTINLAYELRDSSFKINAVCPGYTSTDFTNHNGTGTVEDAAARIVKYALIDSTGPSGQFFSEDYNPETGVCPW